MASGTSPSFDIDPILVEDHKFVRTITMNRPKQLNALSYHMIFKLSELFLAYEEDRTVKLLILKGNGRAFCAGGDVPAIVHDIRESGNWRSGAKYFQNKFILDYIIATYRKSQVSLLNGIVMGAGAGASIHGRFRIVFAMPETSLGHFPDVGASYFLSRLPGFFGEYVGLTGTRLDGPEMLVCGLATHFVHSTSLPSLEKELYEANSYEPSDICMVLDRYAERPVLKEKSAYRKLHVIDKCFSRRTVEEFLSALENEIAERNDDWISAAVDSLKKASPTSLKISLKSIREGRLQGVGQCLIREYRMVCHVLKGEFSKDFFEGCRAMLIDKDRNPKWKPSQLDLISEEMVSHYFSSVNGAEWTDLNLHVRSSLPASAMAKL